MKKGLRSMLSLVLLCVILIPAVAIIIAGLNASSSKSVNIKRDEIVALGYARSGGLEILMEDCAAQLHSVAGLDETAQTALRNYNAVSADMDRTFANYMNPDTAPYLLNIIITDTSGVIYMDYRTQTPGASFSGFAEAESLAAGEVYVSDITVSNAEYDGRNTFFMLTDVMHGGELAGYAVMVYDTEIFVNNLANKSFDNCIFCQTANFFVTDRKGTAVYLENQPITRSSDIAAVGLKPIIDETAGTVHTDSYEQVGNDYFIGAHGSIGSMANSWHWYGLYPLSDISTFPVSVGVATGLVVLVTLFFLFAMLRIRQKVTAPLRAMVGKMHRINSGDVDERLEAKGMNEYAVLAEDFNKIMNEVLMSGEVNRTISELADNMLFEWDFKKGTLFMSDNLLEMFEIEPDKATLLNGRFIDTLMEKDDSERFKVDINKLLRTGDYMYGEYRATTKNGSTIWISIGANCIKDRFDEILRVVGVITNINTEKSLSLQLAEKASYDFLSGLYNRATFMRELQSEIARHVGNKVGLIFIDVDDFKFINDTYGHDTGDEIIKHVARVINERLEGVGFAGRFGGDEFVMCVTDELTIVNIGKLARDVLDVFDKGYYYAGKDITLPVKASLGIAIAPDHGKDNETLLSAADEAMYNVKKNGKSNYQIYNPKDNTLTNQLMN
ncbi:MAG: diguanylate cyclase [Oscillospiraceae bacterium]|nr:diguanylate cyclase [Oscillospiraceae bacterium]